MSNETTQPQFLAYSVKESKKSENGYWTQIGAAFPHKKGDGLTLVLDCMPLNGRIVLRTPKDADNNNA